MLHIACCLWDANSRSQKFSRCYSEEWVDRLYRGFKRNLTAPFRFVVFTDRLRTFKENIGQEILVTKEPHYGCLIEPFKLNVPTIICGLDTVIIRNCDHFARYCETADKVALPRNPAITKKGQVINPVAFVPKGFRSVFDDWSGENDMEWLRTIESASVSDLFPGQVLSMKLDTVGPHGLRNARIVYMHGSSKPHELKHIDWIRECWK